MYPKTLSRKSSNEKEGILSFGERRITITNGESISYVHPPRAEGYIHGDRVAYITTRPEKDGKLPEARPTRLIKRSSEIMIIEATLTKKGVQWTLLPVFGSLRIEVSANPRVEDGDLYKARFTSGRRCELVEKFGNKKDPEIRESLLFFQAGVRTVWPDDVASMVFDKPVVEPVIARYEAIHDQVPGLPRRHIQDQYDSSQGHIPEKLFRDFSQEFGLTPLPQSLSLKSEIFPKIRVNGHERLDFRSWYTMTIDGADAQDLDDAISIARYEGGDTLLGVHIADVAEYVREGSPIDREAYLRGTSIYLPGRVIPMLPEVLSNDLCSLHPGGEKLCMSILMRIDRQGLVKESYVSEGVIESRHRGVYEEIGKELKMKDGENLGTRGGSGILEQQNARFLHMQEGQDPGLLCPSEGQEGEMPPTRILQNFQSLYHVLSARRKKEGKIIFDMTECYFDMDEMRNVINIRKRERGDAHMMIEEFMVLANEEVAKWCVKRKIPFLSRVHEGPSAEKTREIHDVIAANSSDLILGSGFSDSQLEPHHIRSILENAKNDEELYRLSRLLLPKMAKAVYLERPVRHFGLALTHYAHFTSPIRRYPDLLLHRMIKYHLSKVSNFDKKSYDRQMKRWGKSLSEKERNAEDISRSIDDLYMCLYMAKSVDHVETGVISGLTEHNIYVELSNGVEGSIYLKNAPSRGERVREKRGSSTNSPILNGEGRGFIPREKLSLDLARGSLRATSGEEVYRIGESIRVKIVSVDLDTRRIEMAETGE